MGKLKQGKDAARLGTAEQQNPQLARLPVKPTPAEAPHLSHLCSVQHRICFSLPRCRGTWREGSGTRDTTLLPCRIGQDWAGQGRAPDRSGVQLRHFVDLQRLQAWGRAGVDQVEHLLHGRTCGCMSRRAARAPDAAGGGGCPLPCILFMDSGEGHGSGGHVGWHAKARTCSFNHPDLAPPG